MVTATENPKLWRVEFVVVHSDIAKTGIVCYAYLGESSLRPYYSHHVLYQRPVPAGPWSTGNVVRQELTPTLRAMVDAFLLAEIVAMARVEPLATLPTFPGEGIKGINFEN